MITDQKQLLEFYTTRFHKNQSKCWNEFHDNRFTLVKAGRRFGKSYMSAEIIIDECLRESSEFPKHYGAAFIAKTKDQAREILWDTLKGRLQFRGLDKVVKCNEQKLEAVFPNGVKLSVEGADVEEDRLRGAGLRLVVCDEFAFWKKNKYLWQEILRPMLISPTGGTGGKAIICSTPAQAENYFEDLYQRGMSGEGGYKSLHFTSMDNPLLSAEELKQIAVDYGGAHTDEYRREILAITTRTSDLVFRNFKEEWPLVCGKDEFRYHTGSGYRFDGENFYFFGGVDFGNKDPTVFLMCAFDWENDHLYVFGEHYKNNTLIKDHVIAMNDKMGGYKTKTMIFGDHDSQEIMEYQAQGINISKAQKDIRTGIQRLNARIQTNKITIVEEECPNLIRELLMMTWDEKRDKPASNQDDHAVDALRYIVKGLSFSTYTHPRKETLEEKLERRVIDKLKKRMEDWHLYDD